MPTENFYVVDQNALRRPILADLIRTEPQAKFVLPDAALVEMTKSDQWQETLRLSFAALAPVAKHCYMSMSVQEAREFELAHRRGVGGHLLPTNFRQLIRGAIEGSQSPSENDTIQRLKERIDRVRAEIQQNDLNAGALRNELLSDVQMLKDNLSKEELKACRHADTARIARVVLARNVGHGMFTGHMKRAGVPATVIERLRKERSMTLRWALLRAHHALVWLSEGGVEGLQGAHDKTVVNDILDQDYVLIGSFFTGVVSYESSVREALEDLRVMLAS